MKPNTILAGYQILEQLSHKTSRQTLLARNLQSEELVVVKILHFDADCQWDYYKLFEQEAKTLQNLQHPAIPKYLDYFDLEDGFALVQTYTALPAVMRYSNNSLQTNYASVVDSLIQVRLQLLYRLFLLSLE
jgi:serine/threonine protein kinase